MRFTVRRLASAEVFPCCHRPSGGDVACGVHVSVARSRTAGDALENRLALAVFRRDMPAMGASLRRIRCRDEFNPPQGLCVNRATSSPHPWRLISRLRPRFCATRVPGHSGVPRAERVIARTFKSSTRMVSKRRARSVLVFSTQSRRRSVSRARSRAMASLVRARRCDPRCARARRRCNRRSRWVSPARRPGTRSSSPQDSAAETATPRSTPTTPPSSGPATGSGIGKSDVPAPRSIQSDPVGLHRGGDVAGPPELDPPDLGYPYLSVAAAEAVRCGAV